MDKNISSCTIHKDAKIVYEYAFKGCNNLSKIVMDKAITAIGADAFPVTISVAYLGTEEDKNKITIVSGKYIYWLYYSETQPMKKGDYWHYNEKGEVEQWSLLIYELSEDGTYAKVSEWMGIVEEAIIESSYQGVPVTTITVNALYALVLNTVIIPKSITTIEENAFYYLALIGDVYYEGTKEDRSWGW